jgi:hypothetical protein
MANPLAQTVLSAVDKTQAAFKSVNKNLQALETKAAAINAVFARFLPIISTAAIVSFGKNIIDAADNMNDLAERTGISIDRIAAWDLATKQSGTSVEALANALGKGSKYLVEHAGELKKLGINANTAEELVFQLSDVIANMPADDPRRTAIAMQVLGKSAAELVPLLSQGSEELRKMVDQGAELAKVYKELGPEADEFNDSLEVAKIRSEVLAARALSPLVKRLNEAQEELINSDSVLERFWIRTRQMASTFSLLPNLLTLFRSEAKAAADNVDDNADSVEKLNKQLAFLKLALKAQAVELEKVQGSQIVKGYKQVADATKKQIMEHQALGNAMTSAFVEAGKASDDALEKAKQLQKNAKDIRQSGEDRIRQLDAQSQTPDEADRENIIALQEALNKADSARKQADLKRLEGNTEEAQRLLDISAEQAERASDLSDKLNDEGLKRRSILDSTEALARVEESREEVQKKIAVEETERQDALRKQMVDNAATVDSLKSSLAEIEKLIDEINSKSANIKISNEQEAYNKTLAEIQAIEAKLANIAKGVIVPIQVSANATGVTDSQGNAVFRDPPALAGGGVVPGRSPHSRADDKLAWLTSGEGVVNIPAMRYYGGAAWLNAINKRLLPRFADGGVVGRVSVPELPASLDGNGLHRGTFVLPGGETIEVHAEASVFDRLATASLQYRKRR